MDTYSKKNVDIIIIIAKNISSLTNKLQKAISD